MCVVLTIRGIIEGDFHTVFDRVFTCVEFLSCVKLLFGSTVMFATHRNACERAHKILGMCLVNANFSGLISHDAVEPQPDMYYMANL